MSRLPTTLLLLAALSHACWSPPGDGPTRPLSEDPTWSVAAGFEANVTGVGLLLEGDGWNVALRTTAIGRDGARRRLDAGELRWGEARSVIERDALDEWFVAMPTNVEHGYRIDRRPVGDGVLELTLTVQGLRVVDRQGHLHLLDAQGRTRLGYGGLVVRDAQGDRVPAELQARADGIAIVIDDRGARYPLDVDPIVFAPQASLSPIAPEFPFRFGRSVSIQDTTVVVSDDFEGVLSGEGAVFVYEQVAGIWSPVTKLEMPIEENGNRLGFDTAIDGGTIAAGAIGVNGPGNVNDHGAVLVFVDAGGWTLQQQIMAADGGQDDQLGRSVDLSGDTLIAGAPGDDDMGNGAGSAYVFVRSGTTWSLEQKLLAPDGENSDAAGSAVAIDVDTAAVGAADKNGGGGALSDSGVVYVYERTGTTWGAPQLVQAPTPTGGSEFGHAVALDGDTLLVGEPDWSSGRGRAHVFVRQASVWTWQATLEPASSVSTFTGYSVALDGDRALVGAYNDFNGGSAFLYERVGTTWSLSATLKEPMSAPNNYFGDAVAIDGDRLAVSAAAGDVAGNNLGAAYTFVLAGETCVDAASCASGLCVDGFCCTTACDQGCGRCDAPGSEGICTPLGAGVDAVAPCLGYVCDGGVGCPGICTDPADCATGYFCSTGGGCLPTGELGDPCDEDAGCESGHCADGLCCDAACEAACESCAESGSEGSCVVVTGQPRPGHDPCPADACADGILTSDYACDGQDSACVPSVTACEPYACGEGVCLDSCLSDSQCAPDFNCLVAQEICVPSEPICDGTDVLMLPDGGTEACRPYRCTEAGACRSACTFTGDCSPGFVCDSDGRCVSPPPPQSPGGCAVASGRRPFEGAWTLLALALGGVGRQLRRRRRVSELNDTHRKFETRKPQLSA